MNIGSIVIMIAFAATLAALLLFAGSAGKKAAPLPMKNWGRKAYMLSGLFLLGAVVLLFAAFLGHGFQYAYVYSYSSLDLDLLYLVAGFWAGQEGTFLLWVFLLHVFGFLVIRSDEEDEGLLMTVITVTQLFLLVILMVRSPFRYVWEAHPADFTAGIVPPDGAGLNPLLQDPWMIAHPPVLFLGYASATIPFAYAMAGLFRREFQGWVNRSYRWALFCMVSLGVGIFLGAYWAYKVLGWGGYWGWDPVENSSLIPWLVIVALMHGMIVQRRKGALVKTNFIMVILSLALVFYSTFLTRSGILSDFSVHSFGDLGLSGYLIFFIIFFLFAGFFMFASRFRSMKASPLGENILSLDNIMTFGVISLCAYAFFILVGTSMPVLSRLILERPTTVKAGYYNSITIPLGLLILLFMGLAAVMISSRGKNRKFPFVVLGVAALLGAGFNIGRTWEVPAYLFAAGAFFIALYCAFDLARMNRGAVLPSRLAHLGLAVLVAGVISSNLHSLSAQKWLVKDREESVGQVRLTFNGVTKEEKAALLFTMKDGESAVAASTPYYINRRTQSLYREPFIRYGFFRDVYLSPAEYVSGRDSLTRVFLHKDEEGEVQGMKIAFLGFDIDRAGMMSGAAKLFAKVRLRTAGGDYTVRPGVFFKQHGEREMVSAAVPGTARKISLLEFDVNAGEVLLFVEPGRTDAVPPDRALVDVSFKRLIWLVWLGTLLISAGGIAAVARRRKGV